MIEFGVTEGGKLTLERASEYVAGMQAKPFALSREFDVPRNLLWRVWTEREHFGQWFGPKGFRLAVVQLDLRSGGMIQLLTTVTFAEKAGRTTVTVNWLPYEADAEERRVFDGKHENRRMGWSGTLDQLAGHVAKVTS